MNSGQADSENKMFKDYKIAYMYIVQGQGQISPGNKILILIKRVCYFDHTLQVSATVFNTF